MKLDNIRRDYARDGLSREKLATSPIDQFEQWMQEAIALQLQDPTAMVLATVNSDGVPSQRTVLLKGFDTRGFVFYTNYGSRKAQDIDLHPKVSLHFPWHDIDRQVHISGRAEKVSEQESREYFESRPRASQVGALASKQSQVIESREVLIKEVQRLEQRYPQEVPYQNYWGGFRIVPDSFEFWQGRESRLHDRFVYRLNNDQWVVRRLSP